MKKHEYLEENDFYEFVSIGRRAQSTKTCGHCSGNIDKGTPHLVSKFYPEFEGPAIHEECEQGFLESLN
tara:strand:- start:42 stop:248 length:207 start_codon:yes stop_codon:yes gene_type:complete